jgi:shikimate dehydrogenase
MTDHYAVIGNPVSHSKSPLIHQQFAKQTGQDMDYIAQEIPLDGFTSSLAMLQQTFKGINITVPFKEQAWQACTQRSGYAQRAGAVNTIIFHPDGSIYGDNTDGIGLSQDLVVNNDVALKGKRILLLGAGGAARGVIEPLLAHQPNELFIANRTPSKAVELAELFNEFGAIAGGNFSDFSGTYDVIINATAASLQGITPPIPSDCLTTESCCYDMMYGKQDTAFISWAKHHGVSKTIDGLGMLIEQAAAAFSLWRGVSPDTKAVMRQVRG